MKKVIVSSNFAVFLLFFGIATLEAFQSQHWAKVVFWITIGSIFIIADHLEKRKKK